MLPCSKARRALQFFLTRFKLAFFSFQSPPRKASWQMDYLLLWIRICTVHLGDILDHNYVAQIRVEFLELNLSPGKVIKTFLNQPPIFFRAQTVHPHSTLHGEETPHSMPFSSILWSKFLSDPYCDSYRKNCPTNFAFYHLLIFQVFLAILLLKFLRTLRILRVA